jgi:branched-chain amino acid transport system substrate-binding protein
MRIPRRRFIAGIGGGLATLAAPVVRGQSSQTIKVGLIMPFSGPFTEWGLQFRRGVEVYIAEHGKHVGAAEIEVIYRDERGPDPEHSRQLAQELCVRDRVDFLGGLVFTPNAIAVAPVITEARKPFVIFNAAQSAITRRSPYFTRTSFTIWQATMPAANWAAKQGYRDAVIAYSDYAPGQDSRDCFRKFFVATGGTIKEEVPIPLNAVDPVPYVQRIITAKPNIVSMFLPTGPSSVAFYKTFSDLGGHRAGIKMIGTGELNELDLPAIGEPALGLYSAFYYSWVLNTPRNREFVALYLKVHGPDTMPDPSAVNAYDGMHIIYETTKRLSGAIDGEKAMQAIKEMKFESPRGFIAIDPVERDIIQDIYIRRVEKRDGKLVNAEIDKFPQVKDPWKEQNKA